MKPHFKVERKPLAERLAEAKALQKKKRDERYVKLGKFRKKDSHEESK